MLYVCVRGVMDDVFLFVPTPRNGGPIYHVARVIQRITLYIILNCIPASLRPFANTIWKACCVLTNLMSPIIKDILDYEEDS